MTDNYQAKPVAGEAVAGAIDARGPEVADPYQAHMAEQAGLIDIDQLSRALVALGISQPESREELTARVGSFVNYLTRYALASRDESPASPDAGAGAVVAWLHESDSSRCISNAQKTQALRDGGASASSVKPYSIALSAAPASAPEAPEQQGEALTVAAKEAVKWLNSWFRNHDGNKIADALSAALAQAAPATGKVGAVLYLQLTEAMGYDSGKDGMEFSPEEWAAALLKDATAYRATPAPTVQAETGEAALLRRTYDLLAHNETSADTVAMAQAHDDLRADIGVYLASAALTAVQADKGWV
jgi:hypothetical protein